jgi:stage II sporulation protein D
MTSPRPWIGSTTRCELHVADRLRRPRRLLRIIVVLIAACASPRAIGGPRPVVDDVGSTAIRVLLAQSLAAADFGATGTWMLLDDHRRVLARATAGEPWQIERSGSRVRAVRSGARTGWIDGPIYAVMSPDAFAVFGGRRYRGELVARGTAQGLMVINRVRIDDYIAGVVPLEMGGRSQIELPAVQAQAVSARSYAYTHLGAEDQRGYDVTNGSNDQVYGGRDAETALTNEGVESTRGLVLKYAGRVVNAPYSAVCGGETATPSDVWRTGDEPYLKRVSDRIPGTDRYYCDIAPRFRWVRTFDESELMNDLTRYLSSYANVGGNTPGYPRAVVISSKTPGNRVESLSITTSRGDYTVRGNDIRYVLRGPGDDILSSTYFSVDSSIQRDGHLSRLILRGGGNGHGVGMCQWGAIGRARAGQNFHQILAAYYPGTSVGPLR